MIETIKTYLRLQYWIYLFSAICSISLSGCGIDLAVKSGEYVAGSKGMLYLSADNGSIRVFELAQKKLIATVKIPEERRIFKGIYYDNENVIVQLASYADWRYPSVIYKIRPNAAVAKVTETRSTLTGFDENYFYLFDSDPIPGTQLYNVKGSRFDRRTDQLIEGHIDDESNLIVGNIWMDGESRWYACTESAKSSPIFRSNLSHGGGPYGPTVLIEENVTTGTIEKTRLGTEGAFLLETIDSPEAIWLLEFEPTTPKLQIIKYSKIERRVLSIKEIARIHNSHQALVNLTFRATQGTLDHSQYFWLMSRNPGMIIRLDKETSETNVINLPADAQIVGNLYSDGTHIWAFTHLGRSGLEKYGDRVPRVLKLAESDMSYELTPFTLGIVERLLAILPNWLGSLIEPYIKT